MNLIQKYFILELWVNYAHTQDEPDDASDYENEAEVDGEHNDADGEPNEVDGDGDSDDSEEDAGAEDDDHMAMQLE